MGAGDSVSAIADTTSEGVPRGGGVVRAGGPPWITRAGKGGPLLGPPPVADEFPGRAVFHAGPRAHSAPGVQLLFTVAVVPGVPFRKRRNDHWVRAPTVPDMDEFNAVEAAAWLGISREAVDLAAREGRLPALDGEGPRRFSRAAVAAYRETRVRDQVAALARMGETPMSVARKVRRALDEKGTGLPRPFDVKLQAMPYQWRSVFSKAELAAAGLTDGSCRWCAAGKAADLLGLRPPEFSQALRELFATNPCTRCGPRFYAPVLASLTARVHPGRHRPPDPVAEAVAAEKAAAEAVRAAAAVDSPVRAQPVQDDDGRALIARRRREVQARITRARRAGDSRYEAQLRLQLRALTADASAVDGRARKRTGS